jgi:hypothetical protein
MGNGSCRTVLAKRERLEAILGHPASGDCNTWCYLSPHFNPMEIDIPIFYLKTTWTVNYFDPTTKWTRARINGFRGKKFFHLLMRK